MTRLPVRRALTATVLLPLLLTACGTTHPAAGARTTALPALQAVTPTATAVTPTPSASTAAGRAGAWASPRPSVRTAPAALVARVGAHTQARVVSVRDIDGRPQVHVATVTGRAAAQAAVALAQATPGTTSVTVDGKVHVTDARSNDAYRYAQWGLDRLHAETVWARQPGRGTVVAVIDTGVDATHPDLKGSVLTTGGIDYVSAGGNGTADGHGHGTHVAGIIAAVGNNGIGVAGLAAGVKILPIRALDANGSGWDSDIARGIIYATDHGASVINMSLGGDAADVTAQAVAYALSHGVVVVSAAGNERASGNPVTYPAAYPGVLGVAATDSTDAVADFSNTGSYVDVAAPGVDIASTYLGASYVYMSGTSMATPFAAATAALVKAAKPALTPAQVDDVLESTADDLGPSGRDDGSGYGLIDPLAALCAVGSCGTTPTPTQTTPAPTASPTSTSTPSTTPTSAPPTADPGTTPSASPTTTPDPSDTMTPDPSNAPSPQAPSPTTSPEPAPTPSAPPAPQSTLTRALTPPANVPFGASVTAAAEVTDSLGIGLASTPVQLCTKTAPARTYTCRTVTTDGYGKAALRWAATATTTFFAYHPGTAATFPSVSAAVVFTATAQASLRPGWHRLTATIAPASTTRVMLDLWTGHGWAGVRTLTTRHGTATATGLRRGYYRLRVPATATVSGATTRYVLVP